MARLRVRVPRRSGASGDPGRPSRDHQPDAAARARDVRWAACLGRRAIHEPKSAGGRIPVLIGGNGPKVTWRLAARFADELNLDDAARRGRPGPAGDRRPMRGGRTGPAVAAGIGPRLGPARCARRSRPARTAARVPRCRHGRGDAAGLRRGRRCGPSRAGSPTTARRSGCWSRRPWPIRGRRIHIVIRRIPVDIRRGARGDLARIGAPRWGSSMRPTPRPHHRKEQRHGPRPDHLPGHVSPRIFARSPQASVAP